MEKIKVITTKIGLDTHTTGILLVSRALRDAGIEVVYLGKFQTPESIIESAVQESADVIAISSLSLNYKKIIDVIGLLKQKNINDILVVAGGTIPQEHTVKLKNAGVDEVFLPGSELDAIVEYITTKVKKKRNKDNVTH